MPENKPLPADKPVVPATDDAKSVPVVLDVDGCIPP
jgi:hypothetical protein